MEIDLRRYGFLGNSFATEPRSELTTQTISASRHVETPSKGLGADLAALFNQPPETGSGTDFIITALAEGHDDSENDIMSTGHVLSDGTTDQGDDQHWLAPDAPTSPPIYVHKLILMARWPHFARLYNSQMAEFHTKKMHIPEPYSVVKAFLYFLYTDTIPAGHAHGTSTPTPSDIQGASSKAASKSAAGSAVDDLSDVAGLLVMSNIYNIPHLRTLCVSRLSRELDVEHACVIWYCAGLANEDWLRKRAAAFCLTHWGRIVRTAGFLRLPRHALVDLSQEIDMEGRVVGGEELEFVGGLAGGRFGDGVGNGIVSSRDGGVGSRKQSISSSAAGGIDDDDADDDGMEVS